MRGAIPTLRTFALSRASTLALLVGAASVAGCTTTQGPGLNRGPAAQPGQVLASFPSPGGALQLVDRGPALPANGRYIIRLPTRSEQYTLPVEAQPSVETSAEVDGYRVVLVRSRSGGCPVDYQVIAVGVQTVTVNQIGDCSPLTAVAVVEGDLEMAGVNGKIWEFNNGAVFERAAIPRDPGPTTFGRPQTGLDGGPTPIPLEGPTVGFDGDGFAPDDPGAQPGLGPNDPLLTPPPSDDPLDGVVVDGSTIPGVFDAPPTNDDPFSSTGLAGPDTTPVGPGNDPTVVDPFEVDNPFQNDPALDPPPIPNDPPPAIVEDQPLDLGPTPLDLTSPSSPPVNTGSGPLPTTDAVPVVLTDDGSVLPSSGPGPTSPVNTVDQAPPLLGDDEPLPLVE